MNTLSESFSIGDSLEKSKIESFYKKIRESKIDLVISTKRNFDHELISRKNEILYSHHK